MLLQVFEKWKTLQKRKGFFWGGGVEFAVIADLALVLSK